MTNTVKLHRILTANPEKVFRAFSDETAYASWIPPYGFLGIIHEYDFKIGGKYKMSFKNFTTESSHSFGGEFLEIKNEAELKTVKISDSFDDPNMPGLMTTTITLKKVFCGTEINIVQEGIPEMIPSEMCYLGWQESLEKLVEPEIKDN